MEGYMVSDWLGGVRPQDRRLAEAWERRGAHAEPIDDNRGSVNRWIAVTVDDDARPLAFVLDIETGLAQQVLVTGCPQLTRRERARAEQLAQDDERVQAFLGNRSPNPLTRLRVGGDKPLTGRMAIVFLRPSDVERGYAVVDLNADRVINVFVRGEP